MTSPVFKALVAGRLHQLNNDEARIAEHVAEVLGPPPPDTHRPERFMKFCEELGVPWRPASPAVLAKFVLQHTKTGRLIEEIRSISAAHSSSNLPDPAATYWVSKALCRLMKIEPPRSWPKAEQAVFLSLPADLQQYLIPREAERDRTVRRAQNEAAELRKQLADIQKGTDSANLENPAETHA
jgi:hypothetical protein